MREEMTYFCNVCAHFGDLSKFILHDESVFCPACGGQDLQKVEDTQAFEEPSDRNDTDRVPAIKLSEDE